MRAPTIEEVLAALATHRPADIAAALYSAHDIEVVENLITALVDASTRLATYPRPLVVDEADALLYDTLRAPIIDATPTGTIDVDPIDLARAYMAAADFHGNHEFDQYPTQYRTRTEARKRLPRRFL